MSGYRPVRVAGDELIHYADAQATHTLGCQQPVTLELPSTEEGDAASGEGRRECGPCVVEWMAATGRIRLLRGHRSSRHPNPTSQTAVTDHPQGTR